jgi:hypothetical protein
MESESNEAGTLLEQYSRGVELFEESEKVTGPDSKDIIMSSIRYFQSCAVLIIHNGLFSSNEELTDFSSNSLKYLSIPYYLGELYRRIPSSVPPERLNSLNQSKSYKDKFINTCIRLGILSKEDINAYKNEATANPQFKREEKIRRFRREKEISQLLNNLLQEKLKKGIDEDLEEDSEFERKTTILILENQAIKTIDSLSTLNQEIGIVIHMNTLMEQNGGKLPTPQPPEPRPPGQPPIVITDPRAVVKDNVFKPGWNLPTVSIEQAAEIDYQEMIQREARQKESERKKSEKLVKEFGDDEEEAKELQKTRDFDAFKDEHPRGSGNTGTKGYKY